MTVKRGWLGDRFFERDVGLAAVLVVPHGMAMEERAAAAVLAGDAHLEAFRQQRRVRERLGEAPVERQLPRRHLLAVLHDAARPADAA